MNTGYPAPAASRARTFPSRPAPRIPIAGLVSGVEPPADPPRRRGLWWALVIVMLAAVATLVTLFVLNNEREQQPDTVTVPVLLDMTREAAQQELTALGLQMEPLEEPSDTVDEGLVTRTDPGEGEAVDAGSTVRVWVSAGPDAVAIPEVAGMTQ